MKVLVTTDAHLYRTPDNKVWCKSIYGYDFWKRYLDVFEEVKVAARLKEVSEYQKNWLRVDGEGVEIHAIPFYQGPLELLKNYTKIKKSIKNIFNNCDAAIFRLPSPTGQLIFRERKNNIPTAVEVVFDPLTSAEKTLKNKIINKIIALNLKKISYTVNGVSYVTSHTIQRNFPSFSKINGENEQYFDSYYSSVNLKEQSFGEAKMYNNKEKFIISHSNVAMNSNRKGELILLESINIIRKKGYDVHGVFIGDGTMRKEFEKKANELDLKKYITFTGLLSSSKEVRQVLEKSDLYVLPTQAEGLPRGIIEAMALGLPCISSPVGGIPEILEEECLADPNNPEEYANSIINLISNPEMMEKISIENIEKAKEFKDDLLQVRRNEFYTKLRNCVQKS